MKRLAIVVAALACADAAAQLHKCKGPDGRIVYSDTLCEAAATGGSLKVIPNSSTDPNAPPAGKAPGAASVSGAPGKESPAPRAASGGEGAPASGELSYSDRERLRSLEVTIASNGATSEQKEGARLEMRSIRNGREGRLSREDRERRDSLAVDLGSVDRKKRSDALRQIRDIYNN